MTKFTDRLENDFEQIADQATPSPTAWQSIQQRMAEPDTNQETEIIMLTAEPEIDEEVAERKRNWLLVAAAVAVAVLAVGVFAVSRSDSDDLVVTDDPPVTDEDGSDEESAPETTEERTDDEGVAEDPAPPTTEGAVAAPATTEAPAPEAKPILPGFTANPGLQETDALGMQMQFEVFEDMRTTWWRPGELQLVDQATESKYVVVARVGGWYTLEESIDLDYGEQGSIAPDDVDAWIADNQLIAERLDDTTVDGRSTVVYNLRLDPDVEGSLLEEGRLTLVYSMADPSFDPAVAADPSRGIVPDLSLRLWLVEVDGSEPIAIFAAGGPGAESFLDEFEQTILPTIAFGPDGPSKPLE